MNVMDPQEKLAHEEKWRLFTQSIEGKLSSINREIIDIKHEQQQMNKHLKEIVDLLSKDK